MSGGTLVYLGFPIRSLLLVDVAVDLRSSRSLHKVADVP